MTHTAATTSRGGLEAQWSNLLLVAWEAPEELLRPALPAGLELDRWAGRCYVNLVALRFHRVRLAPLLLPIRFPLLPPFAQVNLRTFVRRNDRAGVTFMRLLVSSPLVAAASRWGYGQPARTIPVVSRVHSDAGATTVEYRIAGPAPGHLSVTVAGDARMPSPGSLEHFCKERYWGFGPERRGRLLEFRVTHEPWRVRTVRSWTIDLDFMALFGPRWAALAETPPALVTLAVGSAVRLHRPESW